MVNLFGTIFFLSIPAILLALAHPKAFSWLGARFTSRGALMTLFIPIMLGSFIGVGVTAPQVPESAPIVQESAQVQQIDNEDAAVGSSVEEEEVENEATATTDTKKTLTTSSVKTPSTSSSTSGTSPSTFRSSGTSTTTTQTSPSYAPNGTYTNVYGNEVPSPYYAPSAPAGASAQCRDGTYSFSQSRRGTCSHHGGVAEWL